MREVQAARGATIAARGVIGHRAARRLIVVIAVVLLAVDQTAKAMAVAWLDPQHPTRLLGGLLTLRLTRNPGAAFSLGENATILFSLLALAAIVGVSVWMVPKVTTRAWAIVTGLLLAGISGNLVDRIVRPPSVLHGHVVDFLELPYFPAIFNVADMCLTFAAITIVVMGLTSRDKERDEEAGPEEAA